MVAVRPFVQAEELVASTRARASERTALALLPLEEFFSQIERERSRADRSGSPLSLVVFDLAAVNWDGRAPAEALHLMTMRVRSSDAVGWFSPQSIGILLPETATDGALALVRELDRILERGEGPWPWTVYGHPDPTHPISRTSANSHGDGSANGHARANGNGGTNGHAASNGHSSTNGHAVTNGHSGANGHAATNGHAGANGHGANGHAGANGHVNGRQDDAAEHGVSASHGTNGSAQNATESKLDRVEHDPFRNTVSQTPRELATRSVEPLRTLLVRRPSPFQRAVDVVGAALGLALLSPVMLAAGIAVRLSSPGPVIYRQRRCGLGGRAFTFYKFRSMYVELEDRKRELMKFNEQTGPVFKMTHDPRVTPVGRILRKTSIDEIPQLWNVLKGDMSLVGPRPPIPDEVSQYAPWQLRRLEMPVGLTCIWQVSGRSEIQFEDWVRMDLRYAKRRSIWMDIGLIAKTIPAVLTCRGAR